MYSVVKNRMAQVAMLGAVLIGLAGVIAVVSNNASAAGSRAYQATTERKLPAKLCADLAKSATVESCKATTNLQVSAETTATEADLKAVGLAATTAGVKPKLKTKTVVANMCQGVTKPKLEEPTGPACAAGKLVVRAKFVYDPKKKKVWANWVSCSEGGRLWEIDRKWCGHHSNGTKKMNAGADWKIQFIEVGTTYTSWIRIDSTYTGKISTRGGAS